MAWHGFLSGAWFVDHPALKAAVSPVAARHWACSAAAFLGASPAERRGQRCRSRRALGGQAPRPLCGAPRHRRFTRRGARNVDGLVSAWGTWDRRALGPAGPKGLEIRPWHRCASPPRACRTPAPSHTAPPGPTPFWELGLYRRCAHLPPALFSRGTHAPARGCAGPAWRLRAACSTRSPPPAAKSAVPPRAAAAHVTPLLPLAGGDGERLARTEGAAGALPEVPRAGGVVHHRDPRDHGEGLRRA